MISDPSGNDRRQRNHRPASELSRRPRRRFILLALGVALLGGTAWELGRIGSDPMPPGSLAAVDEAVDDWLDTPPTPGLTVALDLASGLASAGWVTGVTITAAIGLVWKRRWDGLFVLGLAVPGGMALNLLLKALVHRPRPVADLWTPAFSDSGFPSGHTMAATLLYGALATLTGRRLAGRRTRWVAILGAGALVGVVGWSRLKLGAHYLSDVLGAIAAGLAWLALCFAAGDALHHRLSRPTHRRHYPAGRLPTGPHARP